MLHDTSDYKVGCSDKWSNTFTMTTLNTGTNWSPRLAIYGDMGSTNAQSLSRLINETNAGHFDAILHIGKSVLQRNVLIVYSKQKIILIKHSMCSQSLKLFCVSMQLCCFYNHHKSYLKSFRMQLPYSAIVL